LTPRRGRLSPGAAIERAQEVDGKKKSKSYGKYWVAEPRVMDGGELPSREEFLDEQEAKKGTPQKPPRSKNQHILQGKK